MSYLYHATFQPYLSSIREKGLIIPKKTTRRSYEGQVYAPGIYLGTSIDFVVSMCECADNVPESWLDKIIVFAIDAHFLNKMMLKMDINLLGEAGADSYIYSQTIPTNMLNLIKNTDKGYKLVPLSKVQRVSNKFYH